ncbi:MAG: hypothetical protein Q7R48_02650 [bacterium]|nr:hypothetical protein [bacterium]
MMMILVAASMALVACTGGKSEETAALRAEIQELRETVASMTTVSANTTEQESRIQRVERGVGQISNTIGKSGIEALPQPNYTYTALETMADQRIRRAMTLWSADGTEWGEVPYLWYDPNRTLYTQAKLAQSLLADGQQELARSMVFQMLAQMGLSGGCRPASAVQTTIFPANFVQLVTEVSSQYTFTPIGTDGKFTEIRWNQPPLGC